MTEATTDFFLQPTDLVDVSAGAAAFETMSTPLARPAPSPSRSSGTTAPPRWWPLFLASFQGRTDWHGNRLQRGIKAAKYLLRALSMPTEHGRFLDALRRDPRMRGYAERDPRLLERHLHRFVNTRWSSAERLRHLRQHYRLMLDRLPAALFDAIYRQGQADLGTLPLQDGSALTLSLLPPAPMSCEGELWLQLSDTARRPLYRLVLTVTSDDAHPTVLIGCLQGPSGGDARDVVRTLTKQMHGLRPKQLMLALAYAFAERIGARGIRAIGNAAHPLQRKRQVFLADYDAFWTEQGAAPGADGWFELPPTPPRKSVADVPSQHRSAFRRREALRAHAEGLLAAALPATCGAASRDGQ
ncbi:MULTISPECIES: VirK/YbjX family protein [Xanthomonas]|uniref:DUF535 family protein n=1 Tax=Xanthomonas rydalmerensis TaxID=3046274 RepID=A0ABZ0JHA7_9XANT|nr:MULTISPECIES: DUF535 family protein [unclassified Xanthomonas]MBB5940485.1 hypothetical protein [Xanthomonas sp. 3307]WOS39176.1 DUF535 family protein [Xanthomonas sp. DM-2023]WOS43359.1 DUF535 family protein [Xanthomonas sp. DM-2023]WOS47539.1 DUF535 family protein [Xanthomonas sp. DM-2023]WOS51719.1 DUF535 family protein [Xanthomonas sp. DM-2023]